MKFTFSFEILLLITFGAFILLSVIFSRYFKKVEGKKWRYSLVAAHSIIITFIFLSVLSTGEYSESVWNWLFAGTLDFPVSLLITVLPTMDGSRIVWPFIFFVVFGGMQYYLIGTLIDSLGANRGSK
jgi:hypothetical protein